MKNNGKNAISSAMLAATCALFTLSGTAYGNSALDQLQNGTSGTQSTGKTFDGGKTTSDAYPSGGKSSIESPVGKPVEKSSSTYSGSTSTGTVTTAPKRPK